MTILKRIFCGLIALGFILALGTAGSSDVGAIGEQEMYIKLAVAAGIIIVGFVGAYLIERREFSGIKNERPRQLTTGDALSTEEKSTTNGLTHRLHNQV